MSVCAVAAAHFGAHVISESTPWGTDSVLWTSVQHAWLMHTSIKSNVTNDNPTGDSSGTFGNGGLASMQNEFDLKLMGGAYK